MKRKGEGRPEEEEERKGQTKRGSGVEMGRIKVLKEPRE